MLYVKAIIDNGISQYVHKTFTRNQLHNNMLTVPTIRPNPDRIPACVIDTQNRSVICAQDEGVTRGIGQVESLRRCSVDIRPGIPLKMYRLRAWKADVHTPVGGVSDVLEIEGVVEAFTTNTFVQSVDPACQSRSHKRGKNESLAAADLHGGSWPG